jgi:hypothetical protein
VYHKIVTEESIQDLDRYDKLIICHYIFIQNERTRSARVRNKQITELLYKSKESNFKLPPYDNLNNDYKEWFLESRGKLAQFNVIFDSINLGVEYEFSSLQIIFKMEALGWTLIENNLKKEFYTSDHPVFVYNPDLKERFGRIKGFGAESYTCKGVEIFFPLTPRLCLVLFDKQRSNYRKSKLTKKVNQGELDWINTQTIAMAHRTVFTENNDFQFVRECLKKYHQLRDPNRNRIFLK